MKKTTDGFESTLPITSDLPLKLAFHDSANNWDNNSSKNYSFEILPKDTVQDTEQKKTNTWSTGKSAGKRKIKRPPFNG